MLFRGMIRSLLTALTLIVANSAPAQTIAITEYMNDTNGDPAAAVGGGEWVELYNYGTTEVTMTGWRLRDDDSDNGVIPTVTISHRTF